VSAFSEIEVVNKAPRLSGMFVYNINTRIFNTPTPTGSATAGIANSMASLITSGVAGDKVEISTRDRIRYRPGQGFTLRWTFKFTGTQDTTYPDIMVGFFDSENGVAIGYAEGGTTDALALLRRSNATGSVVDTWIEQSNWNRDPADGTGTLPALDDSKLNIIQCQFGFLGTASIIWSLMNPETEQWEIIHIEQLPNSSAVPNFGNPSLPFAMFNDSTGVSAARTVQSASYGAFVDGTVDLVGALPRSYHNEGTSITTRVNVLSIQCKTSYQSKNQTNLILPKKVSISTEGGNRVTVISILKNAAVTAGSYTDIDAATSIAAQDTTAGALTGGDTVEVFVLFQDTAKVVDLTGLNLFLGPGETLNIGAETAGTGVTVNVSLAWLDDL